MSVPSVSTVGGGQARQEGCGCGVWGRSGGAQIGGWGWRCRVLSFGFLVWAWVRGRNFGVGSFGSGIGHVHIAGFIFSVVVWCLVFSLGTGSPIHVPPVSSVVLPSHIDLRYGQYTMRPSQRVQRGGGRLKCKGAKPSPLGWLMDTSATPLTPLGIFILVLWMWIRDRKD